MKNLLITIVLLFVAHFGYSHPPVVVCNISVSPSDTTICPGDSVFISAIASVTSGGQSFDFDSGTLPPGWSTTGSTQYSTPCGPGPNGSDYFWASTAASGTPTVSTAAFDVGCGGNVIFDMVYSVQGGATPCEGPDLANEGVELQYSNDGGLTWITIVYFSPGGFELPADPNTSGGVASGVTPYTSWNTFTVPIPPAAMTTSTMFQWIQENSSGTCCDNWGLENISIQAGPCTSATVNWNEPFGNMNDTTSFWAVPTADTAYVAYAYDTLGVLQCISDSIFIYINVASLTYDLVDTVFAFCPSDTIPAEILNMANSVTPYTYDWSTGGTSNPELLPTNGNKHDTITYYVDITDGCGFIYPDSVIMIVNQTLNIDTLLSFPSDACNPTGAVSATVSGITDVLGQPFYHWTGPGNPGTYNIDATVMQDIPSGWYYFNVIDDVCEDSDSIYVDVENPPVAQLAGSPLSGCGPLNVTFTNSSENTTSYLWDFGNGNSFTVNDLSSQTETFFTSTTVMLISYSSPTCADTAYVVVDVQPCGCTDLIALNYNPFATIDDGSCIYPTPIVIAPNVFTPNGDNDNDLFVLKLTNTSFVELTILNRWGNLMYQSTSPNPAWDGKTEGGAKSEEGTYFYKYVATGIDGETVIEGHGFLHLFRD